MASSPDKQATKREHPCQGCAPCLRDCDLHGGFDCVGGYVMVYIKGSTFYFDIAELVWDAYQNAVGEFTPIYIRNGNLYRY